MFRRRSTLQHRDRESGLAFSWRLPLSSGGSLFAAFVLVGLGALALSAAVRVSFGHTRTEGQSRASVVVIPMDRGGARIEREALEAGPFPVRWNPAADLNYSALRNRAIRKATDVGVPYEPALASIDREEGDPGAGIVAGPVVLPALPDRLLEPEGEPSQREVGHGLRVLKSAKGISLLHAVLFLPADQSAELVGVRYLLEYDQDGRVLEVTRLDSGDPKAPVVAWVARARVEGNEGKPGWLVVESVIGS